jgi:hypothetical protein
MTSDLSRLAVRIPSDTPADVRVRVVLALTEAAIDRALAMQWRAFEQSLITNDCPADQLADVLLWSYEHFQETRARLLEEAHARIVAEVAEWLAPDVAPDVVPVSPTASETEKIH